MTTSSDTPDSGSDSGSDSDSPASGPPELVTGQQGNVLIVRLNRPAARNALTPRLMQALGAAVAAAEFDPDIRVVVLTGTGDRAFCAGLDLRAFAGGELDGVGDDDRTTRDFYRLLGGEVAVPVVGAANATAVAAGMELLLGCDLVVASSEAKLGLPEVKRGLFPGGNGTTLGRRIPLNAAMELLLTGDTVSADRAHALGLVNAVVPPAEVLPTALELAERIAANAPLGVAAAKELARLAVSDAGQHAARLKDLQATVFTSEDAKEGATAFVERRPPRWTGR
jgi:enoyl-CoA hydratase/carnithine racemase